MYFYDSFFFIPIIMIILGFILTKQDLVTRMIKFRNKTHQGIKIKPTPNTIGYYKIIGIILIILGIFFLLPIF